MIRLQHVSKTFATPAGPLRAVADVSLEVQAGDRYGIIGLSGAGKSTLLRTVNLLERPDPGGRVFVDGRELTRLRRAELNRARRGIGMVFQHFHLLNNRTAADNVAFPLEIAGVPRARRRPRVERCLEIVGLTDKAGTFPAKLSGGQRQRVAIARALACEPAVLLCDEPTSSVDPETTRGILTFLRELNERLGLTIVIVTHELGAVNAVCNRVAVMEAGRLVEEIPLGEEAPAAAPPVLRSRLARLLLQERLVAAVRARAQMADAVPVS